MWQYYIIVTINYVTICYTSALYILWELNPVKTPTHLVQTSHNRIATNPGRKQWHSGLKWEYNSLVSCWLVLEASGEAKGQERLQKDTSTLTNGCRNSATTSRWYDVINHPQSYIDIGTGCGESPWFKWCHNSHMFCSGLTNKQPKVSVVKQ